MNREKALAAIKAAGICGIISTVITLIAALVALRKGQYTITGMNISVFSFADVILLAGLTLGIYRKSRACAVVMFVYFVFCKYIQWSTQIRLSQVNFAGVIMGLIFLYYYFQGVRGTFAYQKLKKEEVPPVEPEAQ